MPNAQQREFTVAARSFFLTFLGLTLITAIGVYSLYTQDLEDKQNVLRREQQEAVSALSRSAIRELRSVYHDLKVLAGHYELHALFKSGSPSARTLLASEMLSLARITDAYDQIRLLGPDGMELVRVNHNSGQPAVVPDSGLQNKGDRYYFQDIAKQQHGIIYVSPFDLNVEQGEIEQPLKPMIRVGMSLRDKRDKLQGVLILNYLGQRLIDAVKRTAFRIDAQPMLLNKDGYFLLGPDPADEWAFMYPGRKDRSFATKRPQAWARIGRTMNGQLELPEGLYTYSTIFPVTPEPGAHQAKGDRQWKIISFVPNGAAAFRAQSMEKYLTLFLGAMLISLFAAAMRARLVRSNARSRAHLETARQVAVNANRAKSEFLARMSHEIRTPMNAVIGMTYLAMRTELTPTQQDYLRKIDISAKSLLGIINEVLDFSKIESGQLVLERTEFQLDNVINNAVSIVSLNAEEKGLELVVMVRSEVPNNLVGDPLRLGQILLNLMGNAIKFTHQGEVVLSVVILEREGSTVQLGFSVQDTGIGISPDQAKLLFTPFNQADGSITRKYGGTGLGLTICKRLVEMMGGEIKLESTPGKGSCFSFQIRFEIPPGKGKNPFLSPIEMRDMRILAVDDNSISRMVLSKILEAVGFRCDVAENAYRALDLLEAAAREQDPYRLVITDWRMPGMDGLDLAAKIKDGSLPGPPPKVIMLTAHGQDSAMHRTEQLALDGFLLKPFNRSVLFDTIMALFISVNTRKNGSPRSPLKPEAGRGVPASIQGAQVLLVEDNAINQQVALEILETAGINADVAATGDEAVRMVHEKQYDAVLMDIQMPGLDGYQATRIIRSSPAFDRLPIIAMTAHALSTDKQRCHAEGMNDYVSKPIDPELLMSTLGRWVNMDSPGRKATPTPHGNDSCPAELCIAGVDVRGALDRVRGNVELFKRLLQNFAAECSTILHDIQRKLEKNQLAGALRQVHALKGVAGNIGVTEVEQAAARLESLLKESGDPYELALPDLEKCIARFLESLRKTLPAETKSTAVQARNTPPIFESLPDLSSQLDELRELVEVADLAARGLFYSIIEELRSVAQAPTDRMAHRLAVFDFAGAQKDLEEIISEYQRRSGGSQ